MTREDFPIFLKELSLNERGAEIGVDTGVFSEILLGAGFKIFFSIDDWSNEIYDIVDDEGHPSFKNAADNYALAKQRLEIFGERSKILRETSESANTMFQDHYFDFIYIDADHRYEAAKKDIEMWYPKVRPGGIIAGHDYRDGVIHWKDSDLYSHFGVKRAVDEFFEAKKLKIQVTDELDWKSWYVHKI